MKAGRAGMLMVLVITFQALALPLYRAGSLGPDFPFLALVYLGFFAAPARLLLLAAPAAVMIDVLSLDPLGTRLSGYLPALWLETRMRRSFVVESRTLRAALTFLVSSIAFGLEGAFRASWEGLSLGLGVELKGALYTAFLGIPTHAALDLGRGGLGWARDRFFV